MRRQVGVHIADVTHFVPPDGPVDGEARFRGTSVYLVQARRARTSTHTHTHTHTHTTALVQVCLAPVESPRQPRS